MIVYRTDKVITRDKIKENPDVLYLFGDNLLRKGLGGQAKEMRVNQLKEYYKIKK